MVEVSVGGRGQFQGAETDVVKSFIVNAESLICVLCELVDGQGGVVRLDDSLRHLEENIN